MQWIDKDEFPSPTSKVEFIEEKIIVHVWWDHNGIIYFESLNSNQTPSADLYSQQLKHAHENLHRKHATFLNKRNVFLRDNTKPHSIRITLKKTIDLG